MLKDPFYEELQTATDTSKTLCGEGKEDTEEFDFLPRYLLELTTLHNE